MSAFPPVSPPPNRKLGRPVSGAPPRLLTKSEGKAIGAPHSWYVMANDDGVQVLVPVRGEMQTLTPESNAKAVSRLEEFWDRDQNERGVYVRDDAAEEVKALRQLIALYQRGLALVVNAPHVPKDVKEQLKELLR